MAVSFLPYHTQNWELFLTVGLHESNSMSLSRSFASRQAWYSSLSRSDATASASSYVLHKPYCHPSECSWSTVVWYQQSLSLKSSRHRSGQGATTVDTSNSASYSTIRSYPLHLHCWGSDLYRLNLCSQGQYGCYCFTFCGAPGTHRNANCSLMRLMTLSYLKNDRHSGYAFWFSLQRSLTEASWKLHFPAINCCCSYLNCMKETVVLSKLPHAATAGTTFYYFLCS